MVSRWTWRVGQERCGGGTIESVLQNEQDFRRQIWPFVSYMSHPSTWLEFLFHLLLREQFLGNTHFLSRDGEKVAILFVQCFFTELLCVAKLTGSLLLLKLVKILLTNV